MEYKKFEEFVKEEVEVRKGPLRQKYEGREAGKSNLYEIIKKVDEEGDEITKIKNNETEEEINIFDIIESEYIYLCVNHSVRPVDVGNKYALILEHICTEDFPGLSRLTYKMKYHLIDLDKKEMAYSSEPIIVSSQEHRSEGWEYNFTIGKILEEETDIVVGLESPGLLEILKLGQYNLIKEAYDLGKEKKVVERELSKTKVKSEFNGDTVNSFMRDHMGGKINGAIHIVKAEDVSDDYVFAWINHYTDDAAKYLESSSLYLVKKDEGIKHLGEIVAPNVENRGYVSAMVSDIELVEVDGNVKVKGTYTVEPTIHNGMGFKSSVGQKLTFESDEDGLEKVLVEDNGIGYKNKVWEHHQLTYEIKRD